MLQVVLAATSMPIQNWHGKIARYSMEDVYVLEARVAAHLWLLLEVKGREAVGYAEAAVIAMLKSEFPLEQSINWRNRDSGGTGHPGNDD